VLWIQVIMNAISHDNNEISILTGGTKQI
jgi:hypothetical protein